jgi:hypothetical protein
LPLFLFCLCPTFAFRCHPERSEGSLFQRTNYR